MKNQIKNHVDATRDKIIADLKKDIIATMNESRDEIEDLKNEVDGIKRDMKIMMENQKEMLEILKGIPNIYFGCMAEPALCALPL